jgi:formylglycine-generating enzyme
MNWKSTAKLALIICTAALSPSHAAVTFEWVTVGNPGNPDDTTGYGGVDYVYRISKHEVTNAQYAEFLNSVDPDGDSQPGFHYNSRMSTDAMGGIVRILERPIGSRYIVKNGYANLPIIYVDQFDVLGVVNWLHNGQTGEQTLFGAYINQPGVFNRVRSPEARFFLPNEDEWYKAAFHKNDGPTNNYWDYPTSSDSLPHSDNPASLNPEIALNVANFYRNDLQLNGFDDGFAITASSNFVAMTNYLTNVGSYPLTKSPYGTFDQGGNVAELMEGGILRGGSWEDLFSYLNASTRVFDGVFPFRNYDFGFRVAAPVPEPEARAIVLGCLIGWWFLFFPPVSRN